MKVLQVCNEDKATSWQRTQAFKNLNIEFQVLYHSMQNKEYPFFSRIFFSIFHRLGLALERNNENVRLIEIHKEYKFDIIFIEKCLSLKKRTLIRLKYIKPETKLICYILDDFQGKGNSSVYFKGCIPFYDLIATNKLHNINPYRYLGAKKVYYFKNGFSKIVHRPVKIDEIDARIYGSEVSFIGTYERSRAVMLMYLAENGIKIKVWGWSKDSKRGKINHPNILNMDRYAYGDEFAKVMCASAVCLNFLRKANRDTETTRSIEIPACGAFMLAERTKQHQEMFTEGTEAIYFESKEELLEKVKYYLTHKEIRIQIALAGYRRCLLEDYSYENQLKLILREVA